MIYLVSNNSLFKSDNYTNIECISAINLLSDLKFIQLDTETQGLDPHTKKLLTLQLGCKDFQVVFDWEAIIESPQNKKLIKDLLESDRTFIGQNIMFDLTFLYKEDIWVKHIYDTMVVEQLIYLGYPRAISESLYLNLGLNFPFYKRVSKIVDKKEYATYELSYSLKEIAYRRLGIDIDKSVRGKIITKGLTDEVIVYAATDVKYLEDIKDSQEEDLKEQNLTKAALFECEFIKSLAYTKFCGVKLDANKWQHKMDKDLAILKDAENKLNKYVEDLNAKQYIYQEPESLKETEKFIKLGYERYGDKLRYDIKGKFVSANLQGDLFTGFNTKPTCNINWSSSKQVIKLFEILGIQVEIFDKKDRKKKKSIKEPVLTPQKDLFPIIPLFLQYQGASKLVSTYGQNWLNAINPTTHRIHVELHPIGTDTSRVSSGGGVYKLNQQNLPNDEETRACFVAEPGNLFFSCDYKAQESRIIASVSQDPAMIELYKTGCGDMHSLVAKMSYPNIITCPVEEVKEKFHSIRSDVKSQIEFPINYGGDWNTIKQHSGKSEKESKEIYNNYMTGFPGVKRYQDYCRRKVMEVGYILMNPILGHRAHIYDISWLKAMESKLSDQNFQEYYWRMKRTNPSCDTVTDVSRYYKRRSESEKESINYRIQNRGACAFKLAMIKFFNWIIANNYQNIIKICVVAHDEIDVEGPEEMKDLISSTLIKSMEAGGKPFCPNVFLGADIEIGSYWIH